MQGGQATAVCVDLGDPRKAHDAVAAWIDQQNCCAVIAAAGILGPAGPFRTANVAQWEATFRVNVLGNLAVIDAALSVMLRARYGRIITFAGGGATYAYPIFPAYASSKAALVREVENIAEDFKDRGDIAIVCVAPGAIDTDMLATVQAAGGEVRTKGDVGDVIKFVTAFMTGEGKSITGRLVHVRDDWAKLLAGEAAPLSDSLWKLRRIE